MYLNIIIDGHDHIKIRSPFHKCSETYDIFQYFSCTNFEISFFMFLASKTKSEMIINLIFEYLRVDQETYIYKNRDLGQILLHQEVAEIFQNVKAISVILASLMKHCLLLNSSESFNEKSFNDWVGLAEAPALTASLRLYKELSEMGVTLILLTGREEFQRNATEKNLLDAGFSHWEKLLLR